MNELVALTKFNKGVALVMRDKIKFNYEKHGSLILGIDDTETFVDCLYYEAPFGKFKAFAGREFNITLKNGEIIHCGGQWWHGGFSRAEKILGVKLVDVAVNDIDSLQECYVYTGCSGIKEKVEKLINDYQGRIFDYYEFENSYWNKEPYEEIRDGYKVLGLRKVKNPNFSNVK